LFSFAREFIRKLLFGSEQQNKPMPKEVFDAPGKLSYIQGHDASMMNIERPNIERLNIE
jgi:hypothetical protein